MCKKAPCIGTPDDILRIIEAGYISKLQLTKWQAGNIINGMPIVDIVTPLRTPRGCAFFTDDGLCELHESGLKPTEGKLATHIGQHLTRETSHKVIGIQVALKWLDGKNMETIYRIMQHMIAYLKK